MLGGAIAGLAATGAAIGSILSPYALQGYLAGGVSKSSFNNIHWDEKSARKWACYATAGQLAAMAGYAAIYGIGATAGSAAYGPSNPYATSLLSNEIPLLGINFRLAGKIYTLGSGLNFLKNGDLLSAGIAIVDFNSPVPIGTPIKIGQAVGKTCEGNL
ncbi:hypothetical protein M9Y90_11890 [Leptospira interrogans]|uniref:hypothetical protein n=1 Tax=Leptospira interrogans TaxID=173 RepID=UPI0020235D17|nr:hypothetical protein [Leptospira interrogans]MCL8311365.1 hypothetical protein [Leptospira interrogans]